MHVLATPAVIMLVAKLDLRVSWRMHAIQRCAGLLDVCGRYLMCVGKGHNGEETGER